MIFFQYNVKFIWRYLARKGCPLIISSLRSDCNVQGSFRRATSLSLAHVHLDVCHVHLKVLETSF